MNDAAEVKRISTRGLAKSRRTLRHYRQQLQAGLAFGRSAFLAMLAYRLRYFTGILTYLLFVTVNYFIWQAVYANRAEGISVGGFTLMEMVTYIAVGWMSRTLYFSNIDYDMDSLVRTGEISNYLIRPVNFQLIMLARAAGETLFRAAFFTLPVTIVILLVFPVMPPASLESFAMFLIATFFAFIILAEFNFLVGLSAFVIKSVQGIIRAKYFIVQLCSGLLIPISFFPQWAQAVLDWLPFQDIAYIPLQLYLGKIPPERFLDVLFGQLFWVVVLFAVGRVAWRRALNHLTLQGG